MISVSGLSKNYGEVQAVNNISFDVNKGEITGLLGPNGAGKTTTLRMLTCYLKPTSGKITVGNHDAMKSPLDIQNMVGYLPESAPIYSDMFVYDYLKYIADIRGISDTGRLKEISGICGLDEVMHKNVSELSKGYNQRVGLAHAMIGDPEILILDEPTSGLDPNQIIEIRKLIKEIGKEKTVILSTHILSEVEATCDRVIIINRGNIVADGKTSELTSSSGKEVNIVVKMSGTDYDNLALELKKISYINSVAQGPAEEDLTTAIAESSVSGDARPEIFKMAAEKGWVLYEMTRESRTLENVFRELTKGGEDG